MGKLIPSFVREKMSFIRFDFTDLGNFVDAHIGIRESNFIKNLNRKF